MQKSRRDTGESVPSTTIGRIKYIAIRTFKRWNADKAPTWAASLAFYTMMSLGPLLFVVVTACGMIFGKEASRDAVMAQAEQLVGQEAASVIGTMMERAAQPGTGILATCLGIATLLFGASGVFAALQEAVDTIWHVEPDPNAGIGSLIRRRFFSLAMVAGLGFLLSVSLLTSSALSALQQVITHFLPMGDKVALAFDFGTSLIFFTLFFSAIFRVLPDAQVRWKDVWVGGAVTAFLFNVGKILIGIYLGRSNVASPFGAAGSLALVLIWTYYAAQVVLLGAEFTCVYAQAFGAKLVPSKDAVAVETVPVNQKNERQRAHT